jgi:hypothetical protein
LPDGEAVHLAALTLAEAFTPSTASALYAAVQALPVSRPEVATERVEWLMQRRTGTGGGWRSLGWVTRREGRFVGGDNFVDDALPTGVDTAVLTVHTPTPSVAIVLVTFAFTDDAADVSPLLRTDFATALDDLHVRIPGRLGRLRQHIAWSRPARPSTSWNVRHAGQMKEAAFRDLLVERESACWEWFARRFPGGRFGREPLAKRPIARVLLTREETPLVTRARWFEAVGLAYTADTWRSTAPAGWTLSFRDRWPEASGPRLTVGAKRDDAAIDLHRDRATTNAALVHGFHEYQGALVAYWTANCLLALYSDRVAELRDRAPTRATRPVRQARELAAYLIGDGLDAATVASDLAAAAADERFFGYHLPTYTEFVDLLPDGVRKRSEPADLREGLRTAIETRVARLTTDSLATTANVRAWAELRQAVANTRLQRLIVGLAVLSLVIAAIGLVISVHVSK